MASLLNNGSQTMELDDSTKLGMQKYARFADKSYQRTERQRVDNIPQEYVYDKVNSDKEQAVYVNPQSKEVVVSYRGTTKNLDDYGADAAIAFGIPGISARFRRAEKNFKNIQEQYPDYNYTLAGHSLGGAVAKSVGFHSNEQVQDRISIHSYNEGSSPAQVLAKRPPIGPRKASKVKANTYNTTGDVISSASPYVYSGNYYKIDSGNADPLKAHQLKNFIQ